MSKSFVLIMILVFMPVLINGCGGGSSGGDAPKTESVDSEPNEGPADSGSNTDNNAGVGGDVIQPSVYTISLRQSGLNGAVRIQLNDDELLLLNSGEDSKHFAFSHKLLSMESYILQIVDSPNSQNCFFAAAESATGRKEGIMLAEDLLVDISCSDLIYDVAVNVSGLSGVLGLQLNSGEEQSLSQNGSGISLGSLAKGDEYVVQLSFQPENQRCTLSAASGTIVFNVTDIEVRCLSLYTLGGTVNGLNGTLSLFSGGESISLSNASSFSFNSALINGAEYDVVVEVQPAGQECRISNGVGTINQYDIVNIHVTCLDASPYAGVYQIDNPSTDWFVPADFTVDDSNRGESEDLSGNRASFEVDVQAGTFSYSFDSNLNDNDIGLVSVSGLMSQSGSLSVEVCATDFGLCSIFSGQRL